MTSTPGRSRVHDIPDEIWLLIFSLFQHQFLSLSLDHYWGGIDFSWGSALIPTPCNICRVSTRFRDLAQPLLYRALMISEAPEWELLLRSLSEQAVLSERVKELHLELPDQVPWNEVLMSRALGAARSRLALGLPHEFEAQVMTPPRNAYGHTSGDEVAGLLAALTPNVELLTLCVPRRPPIISAVFQSGVPSSSDAQQPSLQHPQTTQGLSTPARRFASLRELRLRPPKGRRQHVVPVSKISEIFSLPALKTLRACEVSWLQEGDELHNFIMPDITCGLHHIFLEFAVMGATGLRSLLSHCPELRTLRVWMVTLQLPFDFDAMGDALRRHGRRLESLDMDFHVRSRTYYLGGAGDADDSDAESEAHGLYGRIGPLRALHRLKHIIIPHETLVGFPDSALVGPDDEAGSGDDGHEMDLDEITGSDDGDDEMDLSGSEDDVPVLKLWEALPDSLETLKLRSFADDHPCLGKDICQMMRSRPLVRLRSMALKGLIKRIAEDPGELGWYIGCDDGEYTFDL